MKEQHRMLKVIVTLASYGFCVSFPFYTRCIRNLLAKLSQSVFIKVSRKKIPNFKTSVFISDTCLFLDKLLTFIDGTFQWMTLVTQPQNRSRLSIRQDFRSVQILAKYWFFPKNCTPIYRSPGSPPLHAGAWLLKFKFNGFSRSPSL